MKDASDSVDNNGGSDVEKPDSTSKKVPDLTAELYIPNEYANDFIVEEAMVAADAGPQELAELLVQRGTIPEGSEVLDFQQNGDTLTVSMNHAYCDNVSSMGSTGEEMMIGSLVNTLLKFYKANWMYITCEGELFSTEHVVYDFPVGFADYSASDAPEVTTLLYKPNENADGFDTEEIIVIQGSEPQILIDVLVNRGVLPEGITVLNFEKDDRTLAIDLSAKFGETASSMGTTGEEMVLGSLVNTLLTFYDADEMYLNVEGSPLETEHNTYDFALSFYN